MKWMGADQNNVNSNISLAQFSFNVQLMDSYSTDYYEIAYPGLIMRVYSFTIKMTGGERECCTVAQPILYSKIRYGAALSAEQ